MDVTERLASDEQEYLENIRLIKYEQNAIILAKLNIENSKL